MHFDDETESLSSPGVHETGRSVPVISPSTKEGENQGTHAEWFQVALASIGDGVISTDARGRVTYMNRVAEILTGWPQAEAVGRPLSEVFRVVDVRTRQPLEDLALIALREERIVALDSNTVLISRDGSERPVEDSVAPMRGEQGGAIGTVLVFRDVSEKKRHEAARARLAAIVASSDDAIVSKTLDGVIQTWNVGAADLRLHPGGSRRPAHHVDHPPRSAWRGTGHSGAAGARRANRSFRDSPDGQGWENA